MNIQVLRTVFSTSFHIKDIFSPLIDLHSLATFSEYCIVYYSISSSDIFPPFIFKFLVKLLEVLDVIAIRSPKNSTKNVLYSFIIPKENFLLLPHIRNNRHGRGTVEETNDELIIYISKLHWANWQSVSKIGSNELKSTSSNLVIIFVCLFS